MSLHVVALSIKVIPVGGYNIIVLASDEHHESPILYGTLHG